MRQGLKRLGLGAAAAALLAFEVAPSIGAINQGLPPITGDLALTPGTGAAAGTLAGKIVGFGGGLYTFPASNPIATQQSTAVSITGGTVTGIAEGFRSVTSGAAVTLAATDKFVCINKSTGSATSVAGPAAPVIGQPFYVKDCKGDAATNAITIALGSGITIDGATSYVINQAAGGVGLVYTSPTTVAAF